MEPLCKKFNNPFILIIFICFSGIANADGVFYGKLNIELANIKESSQNKTETMNNASRIGFKSSFKFYNNLELSLQIENEIDPTDAKADGDKILKQRNTFIAITGDFGKIFLGTHDTAFKKSQLNIDLFNDTESDIKKLFHGENRMQDLIGYSSPELFKNFKVTLNRINQSNGSYQSISFDYSGPILKSSLAIDANAKGYNSQRLSLALPINQTTIGFMYQDSKDTNYNEDESGYVLSINHRLTESSSLRIQNGISDMKIEGGKQKSIGYDYKINNAVKVFSVYSKLNSISDNFNTTILSFGFEFKF